MFDGVDSPITQTFGLGINQPVEPAHLDEIEAFYRERGAAIMHEVSPIADDGLLKLLTGRGYHPIEFTSVMFRPVSTGDVLDGRRNERLSVRPMEPEDMPTWVDTAVEGWSEYTEYTAIMRELSEVSASRRDAKAYFAEIDGRPIATGALTTNGDIALLAGASTIPGARQQGAQLALLEHRLRDAAAMGCTLAMMCAKPGSGSQRNAERHGFRIAYTRVKWHAR